MVRLQMDFDKSIGKLHEEVDTITPNLIKGMSATLDRNDPLPREGDELPPCWHWMYFRDATPQSELGIDGHGSRGGIIPKIPLPRRMWAGSNISFHIPLLVGDRATKCSMIESINEKQGKSGALIFVRLRHKIFNSQDELCIDEEQNIVYRGAPKSDVPAVQYSQAPEDYSWSRQLQPNPVLLFRYSALTFNPHRIHYDRSYCTDKEGYKGLLVHGPLIATLMIDLVRRNRPDARIREFSFRALAPLFDVDPIVLGGSVIYGENEIDLWAANDSGGMGSQGKVCISVDN